MGDRGGMYVGGGAIPLIVLILLPIWLFELWARSGPRPAGPSPTEGVPMTTRFVAITDVTGLDAVWARSHARPVILFHHDPG